MKKITCYLLIFWLALMTTGVVEHVASTLGHEAPHSHDHASHGTPNLTAVPDTTNQAVTTTAASHTETCSQSQCGHGQATGVLPPHSTCIKTAGSAAAPTLDACWASSPITTDIERPKWLFTTPAVVNLLS